MSTRQDGEYRRSSGHSKSSASKKRRRRKRRQRAIIIFVIEILVLLGLVFAAYMLFVRMNVTKVGKVDLNEDAIVQNMNAGVEENVTMKGYRNIALFGVDSRDGELDKNTRTDTIMIASINQDTGDVKLVSVFRDTYLNTGNDRYTKCNSAYANGGPSRAINMLNSNLDMNITDFVTIGFGGLRDVIDELGGVTVNVQENEISHLNNYQISMVGKKSGKNAAGEDNFVANAGTDYTPVTSAGEQVLNGLQATAYCRIRYVGNDFQRAERQRTVMRAVLDKAKAASPTQLTGIANKVFGETYTSLDLTEIISMLGGIANYNIAGDAGFPQQEMLATGTIGKKGSCVVPVDLASNVSWLHSFLFNEEGYTVSSAVQSYSEKIHSDTVSYIGK